MAKEVVISTDRVNCYGSRFITAGIDIAQYERNPVLLYMHRRWDKEDAPIGRIEGLKKEDGKLIGTPVFDLDDPFGKLISNKWEKGFLRMVSPSLEPTELSTEPALVMQGQTRATVTKSKLIEVSIVDIGANDDAVQLVSAGKVINLATGEDSEILPLLITEKETTNNINLTENEMKTIMLALGLSEASTAAEAVTKINELKSTAEAIQLSAITTAVQTAIDSRRITADKKEHFINLGKVAGLESLTQTLNLMAPVSKPTELINQGGKASSAEELKWSDLTPDRAEKLKNEEPEKYQKLYFAEFGVTPNI